MHREGIVGDELLYMLGNYLDLKPISGYARGPNKLLPGGSAKFYNQHFPLLLEKKPFRDEEPAENKVVGRFGFVSVSTDLSYVINLRSKTFV